MEHAHIVIKVRGGSVAEVVTDQPVSVLVIDYDDAVADAPQARFPISAKPGAPELPAETRVIEAAPDATYAHRLIDAAEQYAGEHDGAELRAEAA